MSRSSTQRIRSDADGIFHQSKQAAMLNAKNWAFRVALLWLFFVGPSAGSLLISALLMLSEGHTKQTVEYIEILAICGGLLIWLYGARVAYRMAYDISLASELTGGARH